MWTIGKGCTNVLSRILSLLLAECSSCISLESLFVFINHRSSSLSLATKLLLCITPFSEFRKVILPPCQFYPRICFRSSIRPSSCDPVFWVTSEMCALCSCHHVVLSRRLEVEKWNTSFTSLNPSKVNRNLKVNDPNIIYVHVNKAFSFVNGKK